MHYNVLIYSGERDWAVPDIFTSTSLKFAKIEFKETVEMYKDEPSILHIDLIKCTKTSGDTMIDSYSRRIGFKIQLDCSELDKI